MTIADLIGRGAFDEAERALAREIAQKPNDPQLYHLRGLCLACLGDGSALAELTDDIGPRFGDPIIFFQNICLDLMQRGMFDVLSLLPDGIDAQHRCHVVAVYFRGVTHLEAGDRAAAMTDFMAFKARVLPDAASLPLGNANFNLIFRQATLISPPEDIAALDGRSDPAVCGVEWVLRAKGDDGPVIVAAGDAAYATRFAAGLASSLATHHPKATVHLHIVDWASSLDAVIGEVRRRCPGLDLAVTYETEPRYRHNVYYTCARFFVLPALLEAYPERLIATLDMDSVLRQPMTAIFNAAAGFDFCCFDSGRTEPASVYLAGLMTLRDTPAARRLLKLLQTYSLDRLHQPPQLTWMLDQAALYSCLGYLETDEDFRFGELRRELGQPFGDYFGAAADPDEKLAIMESARGS